LVVGAGISKQFKLCQKPELSNWSS